MGMKDDGIHDGVGGFFSRASVQIYFSRGYIMPLVAV